MNKIYILFLCLCYAVSAIMANTYKNDKEVTSPTDANIFGHVVDKATGEHLPGITIILKGTTIGSVTDDSGHYMLKNLPEGEFTIEVSFVGFKTVTKKVTTGKGKTQELNFELEEDLISLEGVVVSANRNETKRRLAPTLVKVLSPTRSIILAGICSNPYTPANAEKIGRESINICVYFPSIPLMRTCE